MCCGRVGTLSVRRPAAPSRLYSTAPLIHKPRANYASAASPLCCPAEYRAIEYSYRIHQNTAARPSSAS